MEKLETLNRFGVTAHQGKIVLLSGARITLTRDEALNLAVWLVVMCDVLDVQSGVRNGTNELDAVAEFEALRQAVLST